MTDSLVQGSSYQCALCTASAELRAVTSVKRGYKMPQTGDPCSTPRLRTTPRAARNTLTAPGRLSASALAGDTAIGSPASPTAEAPLAATARQSSQSPYLPPVHPASAPLPSLVPPPDFHPSPGRRRLHRLPYRLWIPSSGHRSHDMAAARLRFYRPPTIHRRTPARPSRSRTLSPRVRGIPLLSCALPCRRDGAAVRGNRGWRRPHPHRQDARREIGIRKIQNRQIGNGQYSSWRASLPFVSLFSCCVACSDVDCIWDWMHISGVLGWTSLYWSRRSVRLRW